MCLCFRKPNGGEDEGINALGIRGGRFVIFGVGPFLGGTVNRPAGDGGLEFGLKIVGRVWGCALCEPAQEDALDVTLDPLRDKSIELGTIGRDAIVLQKSEEFADDLDKETNVVRMEIGIRRQFFVNGKLNHLLDGLVHKDRFVRKVVVKGDAVKGGTRGDVVNGNGVKWFFSQKFDKCFDEHLARAFEAGVGRRNGWFLYQHRSSCE